MKYHKLILIGAVVLASVVPTQAAVYGTLKQDMYFKANDGEKVVKESGMGISIIGEDQNNYLIKINDETSDFVSKNFIEVQGIITKTKASEAAVISSANKAAGTVEKLDQGELVMVLGKKGNFYKVKVNDTVGYLKQSDIYTSKLLSLEEEASQSQKGQDVVDYAKRYLGGRYVFGGNDLNTGVDCSGFAQQVMKHFNISLSRSSREQYANNGIKVSESEIMPGDLVYYGNGGYVNHVAIYAGSGKIVHANDESTGIVMSSLHYGKSIVGIKRVIK